jgi:hypothetical protein
MTNWYRSTKLAVAAALVAVYFVLAAYLKLTYVPVLPPAGAVIQLKPPFEKFYGSDLAFVVKVPELETFSDNSDKPDQSPYVIYENDHPLGPAHSIHKDISELGNGRFSHWSQEGFIFSTNGNSNPRTSGRRYWIVRPPAGKSARSGG